MENRGILYVFPVFHSAWMGKKISFPAADDLFRDSLVYGYDDSEDLTDKTGFRFVREHILTPQKYIDMLTGSEKAIFAHLFAGRIAKSIYRMYEFQRDAML